MRVKKQAMDFAERLVRRELVERLPGMVQAIQLERARREAEPHYWAAYHRRRAYLLRQRGKAGKRVRRPPLWPWRAMWHDGQMHRYAAHAWAADRAGGCGGVELAKAMGLPDPDDGGGAR